MTRPLETSAAVATIHGVAVVIGEAGVLLRGRPGAGKSSLAEDMVAQATARGLFGRLVADDRVRLVAAGDRVILRPHPTIAGRIERRGQGVFAVDHEGAAILRLVIDLVDRAPAADTPPRFPEAADRAATIAGVTVPRLACAVGEPGAARMALAVLAEAGA